MEANRPGVMSTQRKCIRRSQGCMAAQVIFHYRCEPTQVKIAISTGDHKGCFAVTVLRCDFLHDIIGRKCGNEAYTGRIAREQFVREAIDVVIRNWHAHQSIMGAKPLTGRLVGNSYPILCPVGRLRGHKAHLRVADFSVQSKCNFEMLDELLNRRKLWPRLSSGFETKDRCVKCPSRTHRIEIFS